MKTRRRRRCLLQTNTLSEDDGAAPLQLSDDRQACAVNPAPLAPVQCGSLMSHRITGTGKQMPVRREAAPRLVLTKTWVRGTVGRTPARTPKEEKEAAAAEKTC